ncbi:MAG: exosortase-associated EpsI family protein, partial [Planctomycetota bacterium]
HGQGRSLFLYTYKSGSRYTNSFWAQQFTILYNGLIKRNASGALIRLSTEIHDSNRAEARRRCMTMMREVIPHLDRNMP